MDFIKDTGPIERNIAMELVRVTEAAAMSAARYLGRGNKTLVDEAAVTAMRHVLGYARMDGIVVIGEGEKDQAPMLYIGERIGDGSELQVDIAVDPIDGTTLVSELTVVALDRPRHEQLLTDIRSAGARVKLISDGDVSASIQAALPDREVDALMGIGGTTEGVISAAAIHCIGGDIQCKAWARDENETKAALAAGVDIDKVYKVQDLIDSDDVFFAATGVSSGELLKGVRYFSGGAQTQSIAMRCRSGTFRWIDSWHNFNRLDKLRSFELH